VLTGVVDETGTLQVYRYRRGDSRVEPVLGTLDAGLPQDELMAHANEALERATFMCYAVAQHDDFVEDELCFVPQGDRCEILSIRANGWKRHHGDHRRSLVEILNDLAAAVACGRLRVLNEREAAVEATLGDCLLQVTIERTAALGATREAVEALLAQAGVDERRRRATVLPISEAVTNLLLHGGGAGQLLVRRLPDRLRVVVSDRGPGLNFLNWIEPPDRRGAASMGYGFKIIVDNLDGVGLHTSKQGTTLLLDRVI
jgi:anti-sigma regulatory factor (Ser/Thr protein kinase)